MHLKVIDKPNGNIHKSRPDTLSRKGKNRLHHYFFKSEEYWNILNDIIPRMCAQEIYVCVCVCVRFLGSERNKHVTLTKTHHQIWEKITNDIGSQHLDL